MRENLCMEMEGVGELQGRLTDASSKGLEYSEDESIFRGERLLPG